MRVITDGYGMHKIVAEHAAEEVTVKYGCRMRSAMASSDGLGDR